jgi:hypothetical protein
MHPAEQMLVHERRADPTVALVPISSFERGAAKRAGWTPGRFVADDRTAD